MATRSIIDRTTFRLTAEQYFPQTQAKDLIVLHFTAGTSVAGAFASWTAPVRGKQQKVATAYVVDLDGKVYEFFPPGSWAYHLGMASDNPQWVHDRRSIGIEIVNPGPLRPDAANPRQLNWYPRDFGVRWCGTEEKDKYVKSAYRGFGYYAAFQGAQVEAVRLLTADLAERFQIPRVLPAEDKRTQFDIRSFSKFRGVASHQNFRADKCDIGPAWDWGSIDSALRMKLA